MRAASLEGWVQSLKFNDQTKREMGHQSGACAPQFQRTRKQHDFAKLVQSWAKFKRVGLRLANKRFKKTSTHPLFPAMSSIALETCAVHSRCLDLSRCCGCGRSEFCQKARLLSWRRCPHGRRGSGQSTGRSESDGETHRKEQSEEQRSDEKIINRSSWMA